MPIFNTESPTIDLFFDQIPFRINQHLNLLGAAVAILRVWKQELHQSRQSLPVLLDAVFEPLGIRAFLFESDPNGSDPAGICWNPELFRPLRDDLPSHLFSIYLLGMETRRNQLNWFLSSLDP